MLFWLDKVIAIQDTFNKSEHSNIPNAYKTCGDVWVGNVDSAENGRELIICV